jgi:hypothetical protein
MGEPRRIQRQRTKGWRMPEGAVYVGRPTRFGNPFDEETFARLIPAWPNTSENRVLWFRIWLSSGFIKNEIDESRRADALYAILTELRGKDLACWCPLDQPCHADALLELANR